MDKLFFEVFKSLKTDGKLQSIFGNVLVTKVSSNSNQDRIRIQIKSDSLIMKRDVFAMEHEIRNQLFADKKVDIHIAERFELSALYTPEKVLELYMGSMLLELKESDALLHNMLKTAKVVFENGSLLKIYIQDSIISREKYKELKEYIYNVFTIRCGLSIEVKEQITERKKNNNIEETEERIRHEIESIMSRRNNASVEEEEKKEEVKGSKPIRKGNPNIIYGRDFEGDAIFLEQIRGEMGEVIVKGQIMEAELLVLRGETKIFKFVITDFTDSIKAKIFVKDNFLEQIKTELVKGAFIMIKGMALNDSFEREVVISSIVGIKKIADFTTKRTDNAPRKRVELHCHTKMSDMDGIAGVKEIINQAMAWGHEAIAITDHGVVQAFPEANHAAKGDFKVIYGMEGYLVDDLKGAVKNSKGQSLDAGYVVFDIETTGLSFMKDKIIEIGAVKVVEGEIKERFSSFVNPDMPIPIEIQGLTGINDNMVIGAPHIDDVLIKFLEFSKDCVLVAHNAEFDVSFIEKACDDLEINTDFTVVDTIGLARLLVPELSKMKLDVVAKRMGVPLNNHHRAVDDAECTARIFVKFIEMLKEQGIDDLDKLMTEGNLSDEAVRKLKSYHIILLAKNDIGRINLYRLVSFSHIRYMYRRPIIPKSLLLKYREGLIIGSACEAGELFQAVYNKKSDEEIAEIIKLYDYLEIQPIGNNNFMIKDPKSYVESEQDLIDLNMEIIKLGERFSKPVVATCDVHFLNPEDEVYRRIILAGSGFDDADDQAPLYLRTTEEMLSEFWYLDSEKAKEIVIDNTILIADMCEKISPVRPDKCPPVIEDSDKTLTDICYKKAREIYGEELPAPVEERLSRELNSIISNGFAVMYIIAQKLVWKSNDDGYLVGSRGSVGSSFVATMSGITEVNPLSPHYYCSECHFSDFDSDEVKKYVESAGCDMPDRECPVCGAPLKKDGFNIPFETFLGFKGDKEPDIDLNFSGDYQSKAHKYTEVIFGKGQTFRAGTIGTMAEKTAESFVWKYFDEKQTPKRNCEISRLAQGCVGIRRTTGQHPGGIIVLPHGEEICSFTPVQRPANDMTTDTITTHFDYHSIDHNLLKLDILGHDDPTMIRMLEDLTGIDAKSIPLNDKTVMSIFRSTEALGIKPEDIGGCELGVLGIPEFGTDFVIQMLIDTKPENFSDLIRISGLSHGTDVWTNNAQLLVQDGIANISTVISTRDDIMTYLINKGVDSEVSFKIMENVRKGKVAAGACGNWPEWKEDMLAHDVPEWYVDSCEKIKYMFPKAHAAAYVMMAWRIAYCKVFYPLAYYAAYFSIRASGFSYELMCRGRDRVEHYLNTMKNSKEKISNKDKDVIKDMHIVQEMYARGFEFMKIDLYKAKSRDFQIIDGKIMPSLGSVDGLGEKAAVALEEEAKKGPFLSKDDLRQRTKISKTVIDMLESYGILEDLPESNQLSIFDF